MATKRKRKEPDTVNVTDYIVLLKFSRATPGELPAFMAISINDEPVEITPLSNGLTIKLLIGRKVLKAIMDCQSIETYAK